MAMHKKYNKRKLQSKIAILFVVLVICTGCSKAIDRGLILRNADFHTSQIETIMKEGITLSEQDISNADIHLRVKDDWCPTRFAKHGDLSKMVGINVRYVSFYYENGKFIGMLMRINPDLMLYKGGPIEDQIVIAGNLFVVNEKRGSFAFYSKK